VNAPGEQHGRRHEEWKERLLEKVDRDELVELACELVRIESHRNLPAHETQTATLIRDILVREGIPAHLEEVRDGRCNVIGMLKGSGGGPTLMFNGHTDTVPPGEMERPFDPRIIGDQLFGRGMCDMKGGLAAQLYAMIVLKRSGLRPEGGIVFTGVIAEEDGTSLGSLDVINKGISADFVIVAEPSDLRVVVAHKGFDYYRIDIDGVPAHSSKPESGVSAIYKGATIVNAIEKRLIPATDSRRHPLLGAASLNVAAMIGYAKNESITALRRAAGDKPPGATVPDTCTIYLDRRAIPGDTIDAVLTEFGTLLDDLKKTDETLQARASFTPGCPELSSHPPLDTDPDGAIVRECLRIVAAETGGGSEPVGVPFWSDAALFNSLQHTPAIVFGPGHISLAHSNSEHVRIPDLLTAARVNLLIAASVSRTRPS
jgi:acetylornithine deacetylase/succinyl-diaminopimelate desuccinylase-like protein